jgi:hypothetical protein
MSDAARPRPNHDDPDTPTPGEIEQETQEALPVPGVGVATGPMVRGAAVWAAVGLIAGALLGLVVALVPIGSTAYAERVWIWAVVLALALSAAGMVWGGGRQPELEGPTGNQPAAPGLTERQTGRLARRRR